jgi:hypothetical protein
LLQEINFSLMSSLCYLEQFSFEIAA